MSEWHVTIAITNERTPQILREDPKTIAATAAKRAEATDGAMAAAGEVGLGAGASTWAWAAPMRERAVKRRAMRAINEALERAIDEWENERKYLLRVLSFWERKSVWVCLCVCRWEKGIVVASVYIGREVKGSWAVYRLAILLNCDSWFLCGSPTTDF